MASNFDKDPAIFIDRRLGTAESPYVAMDETLVINSEGKAILSEIPLKYNRVEIFQNGIQWYEIENGVPTANQFKVDYVNKVVTFNTVNVGKQINAKYEGSGNHYYSVNSIYTELSNGRIVETLGDLVKGNQQANANEVIRKQNEVERKSSETTRESNESSRKSAETIRVDAETARKSAEVARVNVESARVSAESGRVSAEGLRVTAESDRASNEAIRKENETARIGNEDARKLAETARASEETKRKNAEDSRVTVEAKRVSDETARANSELARISNEDGRKLAETSRKSVEEQRVTSEADRKLSETDRKDSEVTRKSNESARVIEEGVRKTAEGLRASAETARKSAESLRVTAETKRQADTSSAITATNLAKDNTQAVIDNTKYVGDYSHTKAYLKNNIVSFGGGSFIAKVNTTGVYPPTPPEVENANWGLAAKPGLDGLGILGTFTDVFKATASQTVFTLSKEYDMNQDRLSVFVGGSLQVKGENYMETSKKTITMIDPLPLGTDVIVKGFTQAPSLANDIQTQVDNLQTDVSSIKAITTKTQIFTATENQTVFTLPSPYTVNAGKVRVIVGGVEQFSSLNFTETSSNTITLPTGLKAGEKVAIIYSI